MRLLCGRQVFDAEVERASDAMEVRVGGRSFRFALEPVRPGVFVVREGTCVRTLHLARDGATVHLAWDGRIYKLAEAREGTTAARRHDPDALEAPMPGRVAAVRVVPGQRVARGEELLVVEAMKMENALRAPRDGVVRAVHVSAGDAVVPGRPLVELE
jgi:biotin carboxyl carrier protein